MSKDQKVDPAKPPNHNDAKPDSSKLTPERRKAIVDALADLILKDIERYP